MVEIDALVADASQITCQDQGVVGIYRTLNEIEFRDKAVLDPVGQDLGDKNNAASAKILQDLGLIHPALKTVKDENKDQEERQLEPFTYVACTDLEQIWQIVLLEHGGLYLRKITGDDKSKKGVVGRIHGDIECRDMQEEQKTVGRGVEQHDRGANDHPGMIRAAIAIPIETIERILANGAEEPIENFNNTNENV